MTSKTKKIHFVCRGNTFRSRLAAAYFQSIVPKGYAASSSGIDPRQRLITVKQYTAYVAKKNDLKHQIDTPKQKTTDQLLAAADIIVFMSKTVYLEAALRYEFDARKTIVWNVPDIEKVAHRRHVNRLDKVAKEAIAEDIYVQIRREVRQFVSKITRGSWLDVVDKNNALTGIRLPVELVNDRGYWHRGVHVVLLDERGNYIAQRRSKQILFSPGTVEISLGGAVDTAETPLQAALRESQEELGITVPPTRMKRLFVQRMQSHSSKLGKTNRVIMYTYIAVVPQAVVTFTAQQEEVDAVITVSPTSLRRDVRRRYIRHLGRLDTRYAYYAKIVSHAEKYRKEYFRKASGKRFRTPVK